MVKRAGLFLKRQLQPGKTPGKKTEKRLKRQPALLLPGTLPGTLIRVIKRTGLLKAKTIQITAVPERLSRIIPTETEIRHPTVPREVQETIPARGRVPGHRGMQQAQHRTGHRETLRTTAPVLPTDPLIQARDEDSEDNAGSDGGEDSGTPEWEDRSQEENSGNSGDSLNSGNGNGNSSESKNQEDSGSRNSSKQQEQGNNGNGNSSKPQEQGNNGNGNSSKPQEEDNSGNGNSSKPQEQDNSGNGNSSKPQEQDNNGNENSSDPQDEQNNNNPPGPDDDNPTPPDYYEGSIEYNDNGSRQSIDLPVILF